MSAGKSKTHTEMMGALEYFIKSASKTGTDCFFCNDNSWYGNIHQEACPVRVAMEALKKEKGPSLPPNHFQKLNEKRTRWAALVVHHHAKLVRSVDDPMWLKIEDLLTNLRHLCSQQNLCYGDIDRKAYGHYSVELSEAYEEGRKAEKVAASKLRKKTEELQ